MRRLRWLAVLALAGCAGGHLPAPEAKPAGTIAPPAPATPGTDTTVVPGAPGPIMPRRDLTPGKASPPEALNGTAEKLCDQKFSTSTVRPSSTVAARLERDRLTAYVLQPTDAERASHELDHLIPLSLGGHPTDLANLWPEPWERNGPHPDGTAPAGTGAQTKDKAEVHAKVLLCRDRRPLADLQRDMAEDWTRLLPAGAGAADDDD